MKRKKTRSVASYRAASLKGARTRRLMLEERTRQKRDRAQKKYEQTVQKKWEEDTWKLIVATQSNISAKSLPNPWLDMVRK